MSLVAYGDSDDGSSDSDGEEKRSSPPKMSALSSANPSSSSAERVQEALPSSIKTSEEKPLSSSGKRSSLSSLLPKPNNPENATAVTRTNRSTLDTRSIDDEEDEIIEVEEEYVPLSQIKKDKKIPVKENNEEQKSVGSLFSRMPSPWSFGAGISLGKKKESEGKDGNRTGKQPVRIVAPSISQADLDDDDDDLNERKPAAKRPKKSNMGSGLSSLLPKPKHSITTTSYNPNKPAAKLSNRSLIPHTLTKKPAPVKKDLKKAKKLDGVGSGDEDEDEPVSFFSFGDNKIDVESSTSKDSEKIKKSSTSVNILGETEQMDTQHNTSDTTSHPPVVASAVYSPAMDYATAGVEGHNSSVSYGEEEGSSYGNYGNTADNSQYYDNSGATTTTYYQTAADTSQQNAYGTYSDNPPAAYYGTNTQGMYDQSYVGYVQEQTPSDEIDDIDIEKLKKLQGKRNRNEQINIIDINAADQTGNTQLQMTKITSEQIAHRPSKKKGNMPSSQQRRKHQITYLAFQAKEREFELQQQWSSNRQTKRQTQAKYGF